MRMLQLKLIKQRQSNCFIPERQVSLENNLCFEEIKIQQGLYFFFQQSTLIIIFYKSVQYKYKTYTMSVQKTKTKTKPQQEQELGTGNAFDKLVDEQWKSEDDYKKAIVALQLQNQKYRNQLYELGETVNKILDKTKVSQANKNTLPNLDQQFELVKKQLHNVNQFIEIYQKQLNSMGGKKKQEQMDSMANTQQILKARVQELNSLKKQVRQISHKNKALQYKLLQYNKRNKAKSLDQQALQLKQLINENKNLKAKLTQLQTMHQKKQVWLKNNINSAQDLQQKVKQQQSKLPKIGSRGSLRERSAQSLPKLQSEKKIYAKWLQNTKGKSSSRLDKQLQDLTRVNQMVQEKIKATNQQINQIKLATQKIKQKVQSNQIQLIDEDVDDGNPKKKDVGVMASKKLRKVRREWVGKFDTLRFSDSRSIRQQTRVYKVLFNTNGYYQFFYYSVKDKNKTYVGKLPFDTNSLTSNGKQSTFTVEYPDFIQGLRLKINLRTQRVLEMSLTSNLGVQGQFAIQNIQNVQPPAKDSKQKQKPQTKPTTSNKDDQTQVYYQMDIKPNQAIQCIFGSYGMKTDQKKNINAVWLEGLGVELIEDFVQEMI